MSEPFDPYRKWLGIQPKDQPPHHYRLLGIELFESDGDAIQHAADQRMRHLHSLQAGEHAALSQRLLNEIAAASFCLLRADKKAAYDRQLQTRLAGQRPTPVRPLGELPVAKPAPADAVAALSPLPKTDLLAELEAAAGGLQAIGPPLLIRASQPKFSLPVIAAAGAGAALLVAVVVGLSMSLTAPDETAPRAATVLKKPPLAKPAAASTPGASAPAASTPSAAPAPNAAPAPLRSEPKPRPGADPARLAISGAGGDERVEPLAGPGGKANLRTTVAVTATVEVEDPERPLEVAAATGIKLLQGQRVSLRVPGDGAERLVVAIGAEGRPPLQFLPGVQAERFEVEFDGELFLSLCNGGRSDAPDRLDVSVTVR